MAVVFNRGTPDNNLASLISKKPQTRGSQKSSTSIIGTLLSSQRTHAHHHTPQPSSVEVGALLPISFSSVDEQWPLPIGLEEASHWRASLVKVTHSTTEAGAWFVTLVAAP